MTQIENARKGIITDELKIVAKKEFIEEEKLRELVTQGRVVIPANKNHKKLIPVGIGKGLTTKVNANIGTSEDYYEIGDEIKKMIWL